MNNKTKQKNKKNYKKSITLKRGGGFKFNFGNIVLVSGPLLSDGKSDGKFLKLTDGTLLNIDDEHGNQRNITGVIVSVKENKIRTTYLVAIESRGKEPLYVLRDERYLETADSKGKEELVSRITSENKRREEASRNLRDFLE